MAVPKGKASKSRTRRRYHINSVLRLPELYRDQETGALVRRHYINEASGMYRGNLLIAQRENTKATKTRGAAK